MHHRYEVANSGQNPNFSSEKINERKETKNRIVIDNKRDSDSKTEFQLIIWGVVIKEENSTTNRIRVFPSNWELICINMTIAAKNEIRN